MCYYIAVAIPRSAAISTPHADPAEFVRRFLAHRLSVAPTASRSAASAAGTGHTPFLLTSGGCSCGLYRAPLTIAERSEAERKLTAQRERKTAKYVQRGWSSAKIARALGPEPSPPPPPFTGLHPDVVDIVNRLAAAVGQATVWVHEFAGSVESERYKILHHATCPAAQFADLARELLPDTSLTVRDKSA